MESPEGWDHLTACIAVVDLDDPAQAFAFLATAGVVRPDPGAATRFAAVVAARRAEPPITGPSVASRIAYDLRDLRGPSASWPDPQGRRAAAAYASFRSQLAGPPPVPEPAPPGPPFRPTVSPLGPVTVRGRLHAGDLFDVHAVEHDGRALCVKTPASPDLGAAGAYAARAIGSQTSLWGGSVERGFAVIPATDELRGQLLALEAERIRTTAGAWNHGVVALGVWDGPTDAWHQRGDVPRWRLAMVTPHHAGVPIGSVEAAVQRQLWPQLLPALWQALTAAPHGDLSPSNLIVDREQERFVLIDPGVVLTSTSRRAGTARGSMDCAQVVTTNADAYPLLPPSFAPPPGAAGRPLVDHIRAVAAVSTQWFEGPLQLPSVPIEYYPGAATPAAPRPSVPDVIALGVLYFRALTGKHPLDGFTLPLWAGAFGEHGTSALHTYANHASAGRFRPAHEVAGGVTAAESELASALLEHRIAGEEELVARVGAIVQS